MAEGEAPGGGGAGKPGGGIGGSRWRSGRRKAVAPRSLEGFLGEKQKIQTPSGVVHFVLNGLNLGVEVAVGQETGDGNEQPEGGGNETLGDTPGDGGRRTQLVPAHHAEGVHHADDGAEKAEQGGGGDDGVENGQSTGESLDFLGRGLADGLTDGEFRVGEGKPKHPGHVVGGAFGDPNGAGPIPALHQGEHFLDLFFVATPVFHEDKQGPFQGDDDGGNGDEQHRPHDGSAVDERTDDRVLVAQVAEGLAHGEVGRNLAFPARGEGGKGSAKKLGVFHSLDDRFFGALGLGGKPGHPPVRTGKENHWPDLGKFAFHKTTFGIEGGPGVGGAAH